jgi:hypothetical protein
VEAAAFGDQGRGDEFRADLGRDDAGVLGGAFQRAQSCAPQPLKIQSTAPRTPGRSSSTTKVGP